MFGWQIGGGNEWMEALQVLTKILEEWEGVLSALHLLIGVAKDVVGCWVQDTAGPTECA